MDSWRETALQTLPELEPQIHRAATPYLLWIDLLGALRRAYREPRNESLIRRIYQFADWCAKAPQAHGAEDDLLTCVAVCFLEHLPEDPFTRADMPRWITFEQVRDSKELFSRHIGERAYDELLQHMRKHRSLYAGKRSMRG